MANRNPPLVSVILPVYGQAATLERAIKSVQEQTFCGWELLCVEDCSTEDCHDLLVGSSSQDPRIRVLRTPGNQGTAGARNLALREACGEFVAYLDCDDEFYPDYLQEIARFRLKGDALFFRHDRETETGRIQTWDATEHRDRLFMLNLSVPLGVAHRRELVAVSGAFDERAWLHEEWDLWKRFARSGAKFLFLPFKSGIHHSLQTSSACRDYPTHKQRTELERNRQFHDALFPGDHAPGGRRGKIEKLLFAAPNSLIDPSSGAAIATNDTMQLLARSGFQCQAFGATMLDFREEVCVEQTLAELGVPYQVSKMTIGTNRAKMIFTRKGEVPVTFLALAGGQYLSTNSRGV